MRGMHLLDNLQGSMLHAIFVRYSVSVLFILILLNPVTTESQNQSTRYIFHSFEDDKNHK
jgi:hypothetical protein